MALRKLTLKDRDYQVAAGHDIRGWRLDDRIGLHAGHVEALLFDPEDGYVREVVVEVSNRWLQMPLSMLALDPQHRRVTTPGHGMHDLLTNPDMLLGYGTQAYYTDRMPAHPGNEGYRQAFDPEGTYQEKSERPEDQPAQVQILRGDKVYLEKRE